MDKRTFLKIGSKALVSTALLPAAPLSRIANTTLHQQTLIYPTRIKRGDTVGVITPSSPLVDDAGYDIAAANFNALGLRMKWGRNVGKKHGYLAGTDEERLADLHSMFSDPEVKAIVCLRGGSGAGRLLDRVDYSLIARNPKIFMGYSDITAFHQAIHTQTGLITFHGAVANSPWTPMVRNQFNQLFFEGTSPTHVTGRNAVQTIREGVAEGTLLGGNLTVLTGIAGSRYFPNFENSILFLEEIGEEPYRIDRMFSQLALTGALRQIKGFFFGKCTNCKPTNPKASLTVEQILWDYLRPLGIPAFRGAPVGHIDEQWILPVGAKVRMDATKGEISVIGNIVKT